MRGVPADKSAAMMAPKQKVEKPMRIMGRLFGYILRRYKLHCLGVLLFIFGSTAATVAGNLFMKTLIDDYIVPYIGEGGASDFGPLLAALLKMGCVFLFGVLCTLLYNRIMVYVSQGTMRAIRDDLFRHMERLPIRYFDTHAHGDIMSIYTNVPFPVSWTVKMKKKQKETQDILSYHSQAAGCSDKARAKASGGRQPIEECGRTGL